MRGSIRRPDYPASCQGACNLIVAFDGALYLGAMPLPEILDSLIAARRTPPAVAVLIDNGGIAMTYPSLFGNVLSQSGAFWRGNEASNGPRRMFAIGQIMRMLILAWVGTMQAAEHDGKTSNA